MSRVALIGDNSIEYVKKIIEIWNNGDCVVLIDWRIPHNKAIQMMKEAKVVKCYIEYRLIERIGEINYSENIEYVMYESFNQKNEFIPQYIYDEYKDNYSKEEAVILYSSGTTGKAKGIILSHYAISKNADLIAKYMELSCDDCMYIVKTLSHSSTLVGELLVGLKEKIRIFISPSICNPRETLKKVNEYGVTHICVNPTLLSVYSTVVSQNDMDFDSLKVIYTSGAIADTLLINKAQSIFPNVKVLNVYGLTEAGPRISAQMPKEKNVVGSVGKGLTGIGIKIISSDGVILPPMEKGNIHIKTPCLFSGYVTFNEVRQTLYEGWFNTGDIGFIDKEGNLYITGRSDNMGTIGSHNVYPEEVEKVIMQVEGIKECIVLFLKDNIQGNKMYCYYVADVDISMQLLDYCIENLASYEMPSKFIRLKSIPLTDNGKKVRDIKRYPKEIIHEGEGIEGKE